MIYHINAFISYRNSEHYRNGGELLCEERRQLPGHRRRQDYR